MESLAEKKVRIVGALNRVYAQQRGVVMAYGGSTGDLAEEARTDLAALKEAIELIPTIAVPCTNCRDGLVYYDCDSKGTMCSGCIGKGYLE